MQNGHREYETDELSDLVSNWNRISLDFQYENHPDEISLDRYVHGALLSTSSPTMSEVQDVAAWLDGHHGWSVSAISLHALSCAKCRESILDLREAYERNHSHQGVSLWQLLQEIPQRIWDLGALKRSAVAVGIAVLLMGGVLVGDLMINPPGAGPPCPAECQETHAKGGATLPDGSESAVARLF